MAMERRKEIIMEKGRYHPNGWRAEEEIVIEQKTHTADGPDEFRLRYRYVEPDGRRQAARGPAMIPSDELEKLVREAVSRGWIRKAWLE